MGLHQRFVYCTKQQYPTKPALPQGIALRCTLMATQRAHGSAGAQALSQTRIIKKLTPGDAGTKRLSQRYGTDLVCVRYYQDREARRRYTTVEIVVDSGSLHQTALMRAGQLVRIGLSALDNWFSHGRVRFSRMETNAEMNACSPCLRLM